ncbi:MAG TPA: RNA-binding protein [Candidatus Bathyarchaeia archaeon]|nr:RNA-binding protein [Candidatus Bathyarchaeia archaeon]
MKNIYVGNLPYSITEERLKELFEAYGHVVGVKIVKDKITGQSRGFAFVEMADSAEAQKAIDEINGSDVEGRTLLVNEARPQEPRQPQQRQHGFGGGPRRSHGGGGGGGNRRF